MTFAAIHTDNTVLFKSPLTGTAMHFVTRTTPINKIDGKSHKTELKSSRNYSTNHTKSKLHH